jgi:ABC-type transport system substrate-binding protein
MMAKWKRGVFVYLKRNPYFFGTGRVIDGMKLGPYIKGIVFKVFGTADAAVLALRKGAIDMYWNGIQPGYLKQIKGEKGVKLFTNKKSALYFMGFNLRKAPFNDVHFRQATAFLISKDFIIRRILQGQGDVLHSVVPPGNRFYCNPDLPLYGHGLSRDQRVKAAYAILKKAGYTWDVPPVGPDGKVRRGEGIKEPDGKPMREFTILTPPADYDPHRAMAGQMIQEWLRAAGIPAFSRPMAFGALIQKVKGQRDFDCFVLGYGKLSMDPGYLRAFFGSKGDKPRGWNMSGYHNPEFDKLATASDNAMDPKQRRKIVFEMQRLLARDLPYIPLYNPLLVEGVREDRFRGWVPTVGGIGNLWSFCQIKPVR